MTGDDHGTHSARPPRYVSALLDDFAAGRAGAFNHLGHWDDPATAVPGSFGAAQRLMDHYVVDLAGVSDGSTVVDVGCGFGGTIAGLAERFPHARLLGVDVDLRQLRLAGRTTSDVTPRPGWVAADGGALPLRTGSVDHVLSIEAMWHFPDRGAFLAEAARVLRPGGTLAVVDVLIVPGAAAAVGRDQASLMADLDAAFAPWPDPSASVASIVEAASGLGLESVAVVDATANTKPTYLDHADGEDRPGASAFSADPAVRLFVELHLADLLQIAYLAFRRA